MIAEKVAAIVVAGGSGERLGRPGGKQLAPVGGRPVLSWTVAALAETPEVGLIVVVCHPDRVAEYRAIAIDPLGIATPVSFAAGGDTRQASVASGLAEVASDIDIVVVQDGARPLLTAGLVASVLAALDARPDAAGAVVGYPAVDTLKLADGGVIVDTPERARFWAVQTPQVFRVDALRRAYVAAERDGFLGTDDSSLVERLGLPVVLVEGPRDNIKVTHAEDLALVEAALRFRSEGNAR